LRFVAREREEDLRQWEDGGYEEDHRPIDDRMMDDGRPETGDLVCKMDGGRKILPMSLRAGWSPGAGQSGRDSKIDFGLAGQGIRARLFKTRPYNYGNN
jgi:hypothetical protein